MKKKKCIIILLILFIACFFNKSFVRAYEVIGSGNPQSGTYGTPSSSNKKICWVSPYLKAVYVTIYDSNNSIKKSGYFSLGGSGTTCFTDVTAIDCSKNNCSGNSAKINFSGCLYQKNPDLGKIFGLSGSYYSNVYLKSYLEDNNYNNIRSIIDSIFKYSPNPGDTIKFEAATLIKNVDNGKYYFGSWSKLKSNKISPSCARRLYGVMEKSTNGFEYDLNDLYPKGNLKIEKIDLNGKYLNGAVFDLYKGHCTGAPIKSKITVNGSVIINGLEAGKYCIKEITAPSGYNIGSSKTVTVKSGKTATVTVANTKITPKYTLTVNKYEYVNGQKTKNYVSGASMWVYNSPCGLVKNFTTYNTSKVNSSLSFQLNGNTTYCVVELREPSGYIVPTTEKSSETCTIDGIYNKKYYCKEIYLNGNKTLDFYNEKTCVFEFDTIKSQNNGIVSMESRIELYNKYKFNKLLNMSNNTSSSACGNVDDKKIKDTYKYNLSCFNLKLNNQIPFDSNNVTYYSEIANIEGKVAYCLTTLDITTSGGIYDSVTSGRQVTYGSAPLATVRKVCYKYNINNMNTTTTHQVDDISSYFPLISMKKYIKTFTNSNLIDNYEYIKEVNDKVKFVLESRNENRYEYVMKDQYDYKDIILNYGTGQVIDKECDSYCLNIGKGIMSRLTEKGLQTIKYQVNYNYYINGKLQNNIDNKNCNYTANPEIINSKLNLQFEQIMNKKPFMNKEGTSFRNVSYNWWSKTIDYKNLNDLNGDGIVDDLDKIIKKYSNNREESKSGDPKDNYLVDYVMNGRNNSYNSTKEGYRYKIVLTPSDIKKIRKYNDRVNNYNDNDIYCNNNTCSTEFIDNLRESKVCFKNICDSLSFKLDYAKQVYNIINES